MAVAIGDQFLVEPLHCVCVCVCVCTRYKRMEVQLCFLGYLVALVDLLFSWFFSGFHHWP